MLRTTGQKRLAIYSLNHSSIGRSTHAAGTGAAHIAYITRPSAARAVVAERMPDAPREAAAWLLEQEGGERKNGRVVDKIMLALPIELDADQRLALLRDYAAQVTQGRAPWLAAIHDQGKDAQNPHAHLVVRDKDTVTGRRVIGLSEKGSTQRLRELWEATANAHLERAGLDARIDRRTLAAQGIDRKAQIHVGPKALAMEARGVRPESKVRKQAGRVVRYPSIDLNLVHGQRTRAEQNRHIIKLNQVQARQKVQREAAAAAMAKLEAERKEAQALYEARQKALADQQRRAAEEAARAAQEREQARLAAIRAADRYSEALATADTVGQEIQTWRQAHPVRAALHRIGLRSSYLTVRETALAGAKATLDDPAAHRAYAEREYERREAQRQREAREAARAAQEREKAQEREREADRQRWEQAKALAARRAKTQSKAKGPKKGPGLGL